MTKIASTVIAATTGSTAERLRAAGARLSPMMATTAPVTSGGMRLSIQPAPVRWTTSPIRV